MNPAGLIGHDNILTLGSGPGKILKATTSNHFCKEVDMKIHWIFAILLLTFCGSLVFLGCNCDKDDDTSSTNAELTDDDETDDDNETVDDDDTVDDDETVDDDDDYDESIDDSIPDYCDDSDGTVWIDPFSGLMWQNKDFCHFNTLDVAISYCQDFQRDGYDDWRLPTIDELRSLIRGCDDTVTGGSCRVANSCLQESSCWNFPPCGGCALRQGPGKNGHYLPVELDSWGFQFWSSSLLEDRNNNAWIVMFHSGAVSYEYIYNCPYYEVHVRCVRSHI